MLGSHQVGHGMYGSHTLSVVGDVERTPERLDAALTAITESAIASGLTHTSRLAQEQGPSRRVAEASEGLWDGHITATADGFKVLVSGAHEELRVPKTQAGELHELLALRDGARRVLALEGESLDEAAELEAARASLRERYEAYTAAHGPLGRITKRPTGRVDAATGEPVEARVRPPVMRVFARDPFSPLVLALEHYDESANTSVPAHILTQRVVAVRAPRLGADTPKRRWRSAWTPTGGPSCPPSPTCSAPSRTPRATRWASWSTTTPATARWSRPRSTSRATSPTSSTPPEPLPARTTPTVPTSPRWRR